jgi:hypothetical protein
MPKQSSIKFSFLLSAYCLLLITFLVLPLTASAQIVPNCNPLPGQANSCTVNSVFQLLVNIYNFLLALTAFVAIIMLVWSGVRLMIYQFDEKPAGELEAAKLAIRRSIWGLIIIACAFLIVNTLLAVLGVQGDILNLLRQYGFRP